MFDVPALQFPALLADLAASGPASAAGAVQQEEPRILITDPAGVLAVLLGVLGVIFWLAKHPVIGRLFKVVPALVFCYFVPTLLNTVDVIPAESPLYSWVKAHVLPAALLLLVLSLDLPAILRLGPKAIIMMLAGTLGVVIGGPISLFLCQRLLPENLALPPDAWQGMAALSGSWIGGGANFVAIGQIAGTTDTMLAMMVVPDVFIASIWMGVLLYLAGHQHRVDDWTGADASAIRALEQRLTDFQERTSRVATLTDLMLIVALAFVVSRISGELGRMLPDFGGALSPTTWKYIFVTALGIGLSFTPARNLEGAGASKVGSVLIYLLVACIGASANFHEIADQPGFIIMGAIWMVCHVVVLLTVAWLIKAPIFFVAVGSQSNIGGAASAPVVAAAYHPSLAPVGALLAVAGYVLGTYAGLLCMNLLKMVAGVE